MLPVLRAFDFALSKATLLRTKRDKLKPEVIWNIEKGLKLTVEKIERAEAQRVAMTARTLEFFEKYDLLLFPRPSCRRIRSKSATSPNATARSSTIMSNGLASSMRSRWCAARRCRCPAASPLPAFRSACRWWRRRAARRNCWRAPARWRICWGCAARRRSIRGRRNNQGCQRASRLAGRLHRDRQSELRFLHDIFDQFFAAGAANLAGQQPLPGQHDHAVQRGPDLHGLPFAQQPDGRHFQRFDQQRQRLHRGLVQFTALCRRGHGARGKHQPVDAVTLQSKGERGLRETGQF